MATVWQARNTTIKLALASDITIDTSDKLASFFSGADDITLVAKNVTVIEPEGDVDKIDLLGEDANGFQNAELEEKPYGLAQVTGTLVFDSVDRIEDFALGSGTTVATSYTRYRVGDGNRPDAAVLINLTDSSGNEVAFAMDNAKFTRIGDIRISGADGHWEQDFKIVCLPRDFYGPEFKTS